VTFKPYVPSVGDRVGVRRDVLVDLGVPGGAAGSGATVVCVDERGRPVVRLDAAMWATPAAASADGSGRRDGWELGPTDVWPAERVDPAPAERELNECFWVAVEALGCGRPDPSRGVGHYVGELAARHAELSAMLEDDPNPDGVRCGTFTPFQPPDDGPADLGLDPPPRVPAPSGDDDG